MGSAITLPGGDSRVVTKDNWRAVANEAIDRMPANATSQEKIATMNAVQQAAGENDSETSGYTLNGNGTAVSVENTSYSEVLSNAGVRAAEWLKDAPANISQSLRDIGGLTDASLTRIERIGRVIAVTAVVGIGGYLAWQAYKAFKVIKA